MRDRGCNKLILIIAGLLPMLWAGSAHAQFETPIGSLLQEDVGAGMFPEQDGTQQAVFFTPRESIIEIGLGYTNQPDRSFGRAEPALTDLLDLGARVGKDIGPLDVALSGRIGTARNSATRETDPRIWSTGVDLNLADINLSGSFAEQRNDDAEDHVAYQASVSYNTGPWGFSLSYAAGRSADEDVTTIDQDERLEQYLLALNYRVARGIDIGAYGGYVSLESEAADGLEESTDDDIRGFVLGTGFRLEF